MSERLYSAAVMRERVALELEVFAMALDEVATETAQQAGFAAYAMAETQRGVARGLRKRAAELRKGAT